MSKAKYAFRVVGGGHRFVTGFNMSFGTLNESKNPNDAIMFASSENAIRWITETARRWERSYDGYELVKLIPVQEWQVEVV